MSSAPALRPLLTPWQWAVNGSSRRALVLRGLFWLAIVAGPAAAALIWFPQRHSAIALAMHQSLVVLAIWCVQFAALLRLDHPHLARLVPGHTMALRTGALALWAGSTALAAGVTTVLLAWAQWPAGASPLTHTLPVATAATAAVLLYLALALRWPVLWLVVFLVLFEVLQPRALLDWLWPQVQDWPWLACGLALVAMALVLVSLFGRGDAAHAEVYDRRERLRRISEAGMTGQKPTLAAYGRWGEWLGAPWQRLADAWLARATRISEPSVASVMTRAEIVLHGAQHWVRQVGIVVPVLLGLAAVFAVVALRAVPGGTAVMLENGHVGMGVGLLSMVLGPVIGLPGALWASRREQALLLLLPGMPRGAALNRALAWRQARHFLLLWGLTLPAFVTIAWLGGLPQVLVLLAATLPAVAWVWRDAARQREPSGWTGALPFLLFLPPGLGAVVLLRIWPNALLPLIGAFAGLAALLLLWRWHQLGRWPQALPAGRLG